MRAKNRIGATLLEMLFVCSLVGILTIVIFSTFRMGLRATNKSLSQNELLSQLQLGTRLLGMELRQSANESVSIGPDERSVSFLTSYDNDGNPIVGTQGRPVYQAFLVYWHDSSTKTVQKRRLDLPTTSGFRQFPGPIEDWDSGGGKESLGFYLTSGQPLVRFVEELRLSPDPDLANAYTLRLEGIKPREGVNSESRSSLESRVVVRN